METKNSRILASVVLGTLISLLLAFFVWNPTWYLVAISIAIGSFVGIVLYDYKIIISAIITTFKLFKFKRKKKKTKIILSYLVSQLLGLMVYPVIAHYYLSDYLSREMSVWMTNITIFGGTFLLMFILSLITLDLLNDTNIDNKKGPLSFLMAYILYYLSLRNTTEKLSKENYKEVFIENYLEANSPSSILKILWLWPICAIYLAYVFTVTIILLAIKVVLTILSVPYFVVIFFAILGKNTKVILITLSVAVGTIVGVHDKSIFSGIFSALIFVSVSLILRNIEHSKEKIPFNKVNANNLLEKIC